MPVNTGQKFVERVEMAVMQFAILNKAKEGGVTKDNLRQIFSRDIPMKGEHLDHCIQQLVQENHIREEGNRYTITDDGREDVQKLQQIFVSVPSVLGIGGGMQQGRQAQSPTTGGTRMGGSTNPVTQTGQMGGPKGGPDFKP